MVVICRYKRGSRSLANNLKVSKDIIQGNTTLETNEEEEEEEEYDIPDEMENTIGRICGFP